MNIEEQLNREIERAHESGDLNLECTLMLARHTIYMRERALNLRDQEIKDLQNHLADRNRDVSERTGELWDLKQKLAGARGLLELRKERIEDLMRELGQETEEA